MRGLEAERICAKVRSRLFRTALEAQVGEGGMGTVYRARDPQLMRDVAVKLLRPIFEEDRLLEEARAMAKLEHPNVLAIHARAARVRAEGVSRGGGAAVQPALPERRRHQRAVPGATVISISTIK